MFNTIKDYFKTKHAMIRQMNHMDNEIDSLNCQIKSLRSEIMIIKSIVEKQSFKIDSMKSKMEK